MTVAGAVAASAVGAMCVTRGIAGPARNTARTGRTAVIPNAVQRFASPSGNTIQVRPIAVQARSVVTTIACLACLIAGTANAGPTTAAVPAVSAAPVSSASATTVSRSRTALRLNPCRTRRRTYTMSVMQSKLRTRARHLRIRASRARMFEKTRRMETIRPKTSQVTGIRAGIGTLSMPLVLTPKRNHPAEDAAPVLGLHPASG